MVNKLESNTNQLIITKKQYSTTITLNNPKYKNALSEELTPYLRKALKKISQDKSCKVLLIRGTGNSFCSGGNIKKMSPNKKENNISVKSKIKDLEKKQMELTYLISSLSIPTIAVITGPAAGAGFSLALSCDIRIGDSNAFFLSNYSNIGLTGDYGISWYLASLLGISKAKEIMFLNERIYAERAYKLGILNYYYKKNFDKEVDNITEKLLNQSSLALKLIKRNINFSYQNNLKKSLSQEAKNLVKSSMSPEHKLAVDKFKKS